MRRSSCRVILEPGNFFHLSFLVKSVLTKNAFSGTF